MKFKTNDGTEFKANDYNHAMEKVLGWNGISIEKVEWMKQEFKLPFMVLHRGDLEFMDTKKKNISQNLTDEQMQRIAHKMGEFLASDWDDLISDMGLGDSSYFEVE